MPHLSMARGKRARNFQFLLTAGNVEEGGGGSKCLLTYVKLCEYQGGGGGGRGRQVALGLHRAYKHSIKYCNF